MLLRRRRSQYQSRYVSPLWCCQVSILYYIQGSSPIMQPRRIRLLTWMAVVEENIRNPGRSSEASVIIPFRRARCSKADSFGLQEKLNLPAFQRSSLSLPTGEIERELLWFTFSFFFLLFFFPPLRPCLLSPQFPICDSPNVLHTRSSLFSIMHFHKWKSWTSMMGNYLPIRIADSPIFQLLTSRDIFLPFWFLQ